MLRVIKNEELVKGIVHGRSVIVNDLSFYDSGMFGTGSYSRSRPVHETRDAFIDDILQKQRKFQLLDQLKEHREKNADLIAKQPKEVLVLTLQEAFYLCFVLGSLQIYVKREDLDRDENCLTIRQCWSLFCELEGAEMFISRYAAFHYYRSRGWIARSGIKYGCDYVLYKRGPEQDHAQYCVRIIVQKRKSGAHAQNNAASATTTTIEQVDSISWKELQHQCRLSVTVAKNLLLCCVTINEDLTIHDSMPIKTYLNDNITLNHVKLGRYQPERDRD